MRHQFGALDVEADHQRLIELLQSLSADQLQHIGQHQKDDAGQQHQPPWRHRPGYVNKEPRIGAGKGHRSIHIIDCQAVRHAVSETFWPLVSFYRADGPFRLAVQPIMDH